MNPIVERIHKHLPSWNRKRGNKLRFVFQPSHAWKTFTPISIVNTQVSCFLHGDWFHLCWKCLTTQILGPPQLLSILFIGNESLHPKVVEFLKSSRKKIRCVTVMMLVFCILSKWFGLSWSGDIDSLWYWTCLNMLQLCLFPKSHAIQDMFQPLPRSLRVASPNSWRSPARLNRVVGWGSGNLHESIMVRYAQNPPKKKRPKVNPHIKPPPMGSFFNAQCIFS